MVICTYYFKNPSRNQKVTQIADVRSLQPVYKASGIYYFAAWRFLIDTVATNIPLCVAIVATNL